MIDYQRHRRIEVTLFATLALAFAYFHPGGGWNQNARFDQVRALVESGHFEINDFLIYIPHRNHAGRVRFRREPPPSDISRHVELRTANSGDISIVAGRVYPNKPPGMTLLAVPAYWLLHQWDRLRGNDPDDFHTLTLNHYLTTALTLAPFAAAGCILFLRFSRRLCPRAPEWAHVLATLTLGLGTNYWPFSSMLFDHVPVAIIALCCFSLLTHRTISTPRLLLAGVLAGALVTFNYTAILLLCIFAALSIRHGARALCTFGAASLPPILALAAYHRACFGSAFATANTFQSAIFSDDANLWLGMFGLPNPLNALFLLLSPRYGLLATSPVLLLCWTGWRRLHAESTTRSTTTCIAAIFLTLWLLHSSFNGWDGGYSFGPRYLIPTLPFLCLLLPPAFAALPKWAARLASISFVIMFLANAVNPLIPNNYIEPHSQFLLPLLAGRSIRLIDSHNHPPTFDTTYEPPISSNPRSIAEYGFPKSMFPPGSAESRWSAFNMSEGFFPESRLSLAPLLLAFALAARSLCAALRKSRASIN